MELDSWESAAHSVDPSKRHPQIFLDTAINIDGPFLSGAVVSVSIMKGAGEFIEESLAPKVTAIGSPL